MNENQTTEEITKDQERKLTESRLRMILRMPYYGNFILGVDMVPDRKLQHTCATDGRVIRYNPERLLSKEVDEIVAYLAHEVLHLSFKHPLRRGHRDPKIWNLACDAVVNPILITDKIGKMPAKYFYHPPFANMTAEAVYDQLVKMMPPPPPQGGQGKPPPGKGKPPPGGSGRQRVGNGDYDMDSDDPGEMGSVADPQSKDGEGKASEGEMAVIEASIDGKIAAAAQAAKAQGALPAGFERMLVEALKPKIDWRDRLKKFVAKTIQTDFTWMRPSRRALANGVYMPSAVKSGCGKILVIVDTSGSIGNEELQQYFGEIKAIFEDCNPEEMHIMYCDAAVAGHDVFRFGDTPKLNPRGGGGTDFRPPFKKADRDNINPQCAIYLTDMYGPFPENPPPYPVLWVATSDVVAPHGETVPLKL